MELKEYFEIVKKRIWIIIAFVLVFACASAFISFVLLEPIYQANTTIFVGKTVDTQGAGFYSDLVIGTQLVKDYRELVKSRLVSNTVIEELGLYNMTASQLSGKLGVNLKSDTRIIEITVVDKDSRLAKNIADKVAEVFKVKVVELMDVENVQIIDKAIIPSNPIKPRKQLNIIIAIFMGTMVGLGLVFLIEYLDNTIKTPEDVQKHLGIPVIGTIPNFPNVK